MGHESIENAARLTRGRLSRIVKVFDLLEEMFVLGFLSNEELYDYDEQFSSLVIALYGKEKYDEYLAYVNY